MVVGEALVAGNKMMGQEGGALGMCAEYALALDKALWRWARRWRQGAAWRGGRGGRYAPAVLEEQRNGEFQFKEWKNAGRGCV